MVNNLGASVIHVFTSFLMKKPAVASYSLLTAIALRGHISGCLPTGETGARLTIFSNRKLLKIECHSKGYGRHALPDKASRNRILEFLLQHKDPDLAMLIGMLACR